MNKLMLLPCILVPLIIIYVAKNWHHDPEAFRADLTKKYNIGLLITATGKYINFVDPLIQTAERYFCTHHNVTYFVFTDGVAPVHQKVVKIPHVQMGWPYDTMMRFHTYYKHQDSFAHMDYLFAIDADMLFNAPIGDEILSDRVGVRHPQFLFERGIYETNPLSTAYIHRSEGKRYFAGGFYGGTRPEFLRLVRTTMQSIDTDLARGFVAVFNDESHLNRYFIDNPPSRALSPAYCHFENWQQSPYPKKILALDKVCAQTRRAAWLNPLEYYVKYMGDILASQGSPQHAA
jgi:histo-blood group ABO system transferase